VREIAGDIVIDRSLFLPQDGIPVIDDRPLRAYNAAPDALLVNFNAVRLAFVPQQQNVAVMAQPWPPSLEIANLLRLADGPCGDWKEAVFASVAERAGRYRLILSGDYPASCGEKRWHLNVMPHTQLVLGVFRQLWQELGGSLAGGMREGEVPPAARLLAEVESPPLGEMVRDINTHSNNVMARQLLLALGATAADKQAISAADGAAAIQAWLAAKGLRFPELVLENGSGLSRRERISAASLARLLAAAWESPLMPAFVASLPLAGSNGTMKKRLAASPARGRAYLKTGSLEGVRALAGYVLDAAGNWQIVVLLINHANASHSKAAQDALVEWVYQRPGAGS